MFFCKEVQTNRECEQIIKLLIENKISANFYHAGVSLKERKKRQNNWKENKVRVMVSTNAFGMGIDKANVRIVIHLDIPSTIEAYFQEAGRAGRDGKHAFAILIYNNSDIKKLKDFVSLHFLSVDEKLKCRVLNVLLPNLISSLPKNVTFCLIILPETALICAFAFTIP